jgi:AcrR family transcriptional regulator
MLVMSRPPHAREAVLDAFEALLYDGGERAATMDATARAAGVSKGGLLYHFASKDALEAGLIQRMAELAEDDVAQMRDAAAGPVDAFIRTSMNTNSPLDRAIVAVSRLAQSGSAAAVAALHRLRALWADALRPHARDEAALQLIMLVADGLYFTNSLGTGVVPLPAPEGAQLDALVALVESATRR